MILTGKFINALFCEQVSTLPNTLINVINFNNLINSLFGMQIKV